MCRIGRGEPCFETRFRWRSSHFRFLLQTSSGEGRLRQVRCLASTSCPASHLVLTEFGAVYTHAVEQDGEFAGNGDHRATAAFGAD